MSSKYKSPLFKPRIIPASSTPVNTSQNLESPSQLKSSSYKSPLIKSRNTSATTSTPVNIQKNLDRLFQQDSTSSTDNLLNTLVVYDTTPQHNFVGQKKLYARSKGSPYQWKSHNTNNSCSSDLNSSGTQQEASGSHEFSPDFNKFKKQNHYNNPNLNNKNNGEHFFHPSMLEDPWAQLLNNQTKKTE
ncbi:M-phase-specific PLK1-interacting protein-like [Cinara cedri]|uniref:M-phase-specific PLK1-interacting protein-like n=1 Tax=Cinara cedri TaxID=506608 RepID=A0A5E4N4K0_9HEMI|nr:M-phase-specific PLK1-interacting protein-like [Cinara cedri]